MLPARLEVPAGFALWAKTGKGTRPPGPAFPYQDWSPPHCGQATCVETAPSKAQPQAQL